MIWQHYTLLMKTFLYTIVQALAFIFTLIHNSKTRLAELKNNSAVSSKNKLSLQDVIAGSLFNSAKIVLLSRNLRKKRQQYLHT